MTKKKFQPIQFHTDKPDDVFQHHTLDVAKAIILGIEYGISARKKKVEFAQVIIKEFLVITLSVDSREFLDLLDENLQILVEHEEYELCALAVKLKDKINKKNEKVTKKIGLVV
jgi:hypothetical protein